MVKRNVTKGIVVLIFLLLMCFGMAISAQAVGDGGYVVAPPSGQNVTNVFNIVGTTKVDTKYPNVAIATLDTTNQFGALWSKEQLDLTKPFSTEMYLYLGHASGKSGTLADGMTFTMHNNSSALTQMVGGRGEGLGVYRGRRSLGGNSTAADGSYLKNSLVIEFDTYRNTIAGWSYVDDPACSGYSAHCSLVIPKSNTIYLSDHNNTFYFNPVQKWVKFTVEWTPNSSKGGTLKYSFNGTTKQYSISNVNTVFGGTKVYWGFTGATGAYSSVQAVAVTSLPSLPEAVPGAAKSSANLTTTSGKANVGDVIQYTITASNTGDTASTWSDVTVSDTLPEGVTLVTNSVTVNGASITYTYNQSTRLLTANLGSIAGGVTKTLVFRATVNAGTYGRTIVNTAVVGGITVKDKGISVIEKTAPPVINSVMETDDTVTGTGVAGATVTVTFANGTSVNTTVKADGTWAVNIPNDVQLNVDDLIKAVQQETGKLVSDSVSTTVVGDPTIIPAIDVYVENMTTGLSYAAAGDLLLYDVVVANNGTASSTWQSAYVTFHISKSLTLQESTIRVNNRIITSSQYSYDSTANTLTLYLGDIAGGIGFSISFRGAVNSDISSIEEVVLNSELGSLIRRSILFRW